MAKRVPSKKSKVVMVESKPLFDDLSPHAKQAIGAVLMTVIGVFFVAALFEFGGLVGGYTQVTLYWLFGTGAYLAPLVCAFYVFALLNPKPDESVSVSKVVGIAVLFATLLGALELYAATYGGMVGLALLWPLSYLVGTTVAGVVLFGFVLISSFLIFNTGIGLPGFLKPKLTEEHDDIENLKLSGEHADEFDTCSCRT